MDEGGPTLGGQDPPLFLVEADIGIEANTQQGDHLTDRDTGGLTHSESG